jgi:hypothetical protein
LSGSSILLDRFLRTHRAGNEIAEAGAPYWLPIAFLCVSALTTARAPIGAAIASLDANAKDKNLHGIWRK